jgi:hypothetical protein
VSRFDDEYVKSRRLDRRTAAAHFEILALVPPEKRDKVHRLLLMKPQANRAAFNIVDAKAWCVDRENTTGGDIDRLTIIEECIATGLFQDVTVTQIDTVWNGGSYRGVGKVRKARRQK